MKISKGPGELKPEIRKGPRLKKGGSVALIAAAIACFVAEAVGGGNEARAIELKELTVQNIVRKSYSDPRLRGLISTDSMKVPCTGAKADLLQEGDDLIFRHREEIRAMYDALCKEALPDGPCPTDFLDVVLGSYAPGVGVGERYCPPNLEQSSENIFESIANDGKALGVSISFLEGRPSWVIFDRAFNLNDASACQDVSTDAHERVHALMNKSHEIGSVIDGVRVGGDYIYVFGDAVQLVCTQERYKEGLKRSIARWKRAKDN